MKNNPTPLRWLILGIFLVISGGCVTTVEKVDDARFYQVIDDALYEDIDRDR